ncbi:hypothetical protein PCASD_22751 [Puccinia coronata f. sp. avenae]|uniref:Uncharacterized protein n=1 Tax=Puccinia coronata f. sp. avenae TaxID=200324 RepID=A0A2N5SAC4_9BASI|nr:hypothetical protein PCASD_22751 [Puccinia coronata f. sp. avenae]
MDELSQMKISANEMGGLFLQNSFLAPAGVNPKTFEFSVGQHLENLKSPSFSDVATIIQAASSKTKNKLAVAAEHQLMDLDAINAICPQQPRYKLPQKRGVTGGAPLQPRNQLSVNKATRFRGVVLNEALKAKWGNNCRYCKQAGHWYNNCALYWDDIKNCIINIPRETLTSCS